MTMAAVLGGILTDSDAMICMGAAASAMAQPDAARKIADRVLAIGGGL